MDLDNAEDPREVALDEGVSRDASSPNHSVDPVLDAVAKFHPKQRVYAKDISCGLWYEAVIRRCLYGVNHNTQVHIGLVCDDSEIEDILQSTAAPSYHYFVHYNNWNVNWDRWVSEEDIMEDNAVSKGIADRFTMEHKNLQKEFKKGSRKRTGNNGAAFLKAWRKRMDQIMEELERETLKQQVSEAKLHEQLHITEDDGDGARKVATGYKAADVFKKTLDGEKSDVTGAKSRISAHQSTSAGTDAGPQGKQGSKATQNSKSSAVKTRVTTNYDKELQLRLKGLEGKTCSTETTYKISLPFSLKKIMVEAWEIINQCQMVADLPAKVTVKGALDKYLQSKLDLIVPATTTKSDVDTIELKKGNETNDADGGGLLQKSEEQTELHARKQEWIDMVDGIAMFFDEALPFRLLYGQELAQFQIVESTFEEQVADADATAGVQSETPVCGQSERSEMDGKDLAPTEDAMECDPYIPASSATPSEAENEGAKQTDVNAAKEPDGSAGDATTPNNATKSDKASTLNESKGGGDRKTTGNARSMQPSEVYGCEHLLRFFVKVPEILADRQSKLTNDTEALVAFENQTKQVLGKINDLIRFLHKHQSTMFADSYRKLNDAELREEQKWIRHLERKRKRVEDTEQLEDAAAKASSDASVDSSKNEEMDSVAAKGQQVQKVS
jgi:MRG/RNA binding activity-knot of a chromodomain